MLGNKNSRAIDSLRVKSISDKRKLSAIHLRWVWMASIKFCSRKEHKNLLQLLFFFLLVGERRILLRKRGKLQKVE